MIRTLKNKATGATLVASLLSIPIALMVFAGCSWDTKPETENPGQGGNINSTYYTTDKGTRVECIYITRGSSQYATGGPACWPVQK